jgi:tetratricopeptide (TPR) repeat protein
LGQRKQAHLRWGAAESAYKRAWQFDARNYAIAEHLADLFAARATWNPTQRELLSQEAIRWYDRALTLNPHNHDALVKKARLYDGLGHRDKARDYFLHAIAARPVRAAYQTELGLHHDRWNEASAAQDALSRALKLDPHDERARQQLSSLTAEAAPSGPHR